MRPNPRRDAGRPTEQASGGRLPQPGDIVTVEPQMCPGQLARTVRLQLSRPVEPAADDRLAGVPVERRRWWLLTGWQLNDAGQPVLLCALRVRANSVDVSTAPPGVSSIYY
ncbi:hypothetical protein AB0I55_23125 [Actinocatenispora sera]|uniref:hypothetical protein n=1 Tax=Actinocatenispora sera TaxID=390989 RepID=UPI0033C6908B